MSERVSLTDARLLEIRQLDENDSGDALVDAVGELLDEVERLRDEIDRIADDCDDIVLAKRELRKLLKEVS